MSRLKIRGVGRIADNPQALLVYFDRMPTDDELRALHDSLKDDDARASVDNIVDAAFGATQHRHRKPPIIWDEESDVPREVWGQSPVSE